MKKWSVAVFTAWPDLIQDKHSKFCVSFQNSCHQIIQDTFSSNNVSGNLVRYAAWMHDRKWHKDFDFCLFITQPVVVELSDFLSRLDDIHTTYTDADQQILLYQRKQVWQSKIIDIEKSPPAVGIILIDCWQDLINPDSYSWSPPNVEFFTTMKKYLGHYNIKSLVFHTGLFGGYPLATELEPWAQQPHAISIMNISMFQQHYQEIKLRDWIVVGAVWQRCTHDKPLGFLNLLQLKKQDPELRIFSHMECTAKLADTRIQPPILSVCDTNDYQQDTLLWKSNGKLPELILE